MRMPNHKNQPMSRNTVIQIAFILFVAANSCWAGGCVEKSVLCEKKLPDVNSVEIILTQLNQATSQLQSYQCRIEYLTSQPLFETETLRKGVLYYQKSPKASKFRINFQTLKQDDEKEQEYIEHYLFDGIWLTILDYQIKTCRRRQITEPNKPVDGFDLVAKNLPIIGFTKVENLKKEFEIKLVKQQKNEPNNFVHLYLKVKPDSIYKDDYISIDFWVDEKVWLPVKITTESTEKDIYQIKLSTVKVNRKIDEKIFDIKIPEGFSPPEIIPLEQNAK